MSEPKNERTPTRPKHPTVQAQEGLRESLDELAKNVDELVDRLTMDMTDAPVETNQAGEPETPPPAAEPAAPASASPAAEPAASASTSPASSSVEEDSEIAGLAEQVIDRVTGEPSSAETAGGGAKPARPPETTPGSAPADSEVDALVDRMVDSLSGTEAAESSPIPEPPGTTGLATDDSPGPEELEPAADSVEPATEMTAVPERVAEPPTAAKRESPARSDVIPWTTTSPPAKTARKGLWWKLIAAGLFIGLLAATSWMIFSPEQPSVEGLKTASLAGESRDPAGARNRAGSLVFPFDRGDRIEESVEDDATAPAETTAEPETPAETPEPPTESTKPAPTATPSTPRAAESKPRAAESKPAVTETPSRAPVETTKKTAVAPPKAPPERPAAKADVDPPSPKPTEPTPRPAPKPASRPPDTTSKTPVAPTPVPSPPAPTAKPELDPIEPDPGPQLAAGPTGPAPTEADITPPRLVTRQEPVYPSRARKRGEGGVVELKVLVNEQGRVVRVVVEAGLPGSELEARAIDAALRSTYRPATEGGQSVRAWVTERFVFEP